MEMPLVDALRAAAKRLEEYAELQQRVIRGCDRISNLTVRIAVFGPFNVGKSTLLNALLGDRMLPMDLIPTTGAAIAVKAGDQLRTQITLADGHQITADGTALLEEYAILNDQRQMRADVAGVEVITPAPLLKPGVELIDLPGTNDREAQDALVQAQLLEADLVVQVLDGRQLMTLLEREQLRDWLLDRGITTVIFVVNFLNLVEPDDQQQVMTRLRFVAESFRTHLPSGMSNLYRVDALPALRAKRQGDGGALTDSGLPVLESALQNFIRIPQQELQAIRTPRLQALAEEVGSILEGKISAIQAEQDAQQQRQEKRRQIKRQAQTLLRQDFQQQSQKLQTWLELPNLIQQYQTSAALALQESMFEIWVTRTFRPAWLEHQKAVVAPIHKACEFFEQPRPADLWVAFPTAPELATAPSPESKPSEKSEKDGTPIALATGVGLLLSGPVGAAVLGGASYLLNQRGKSNDAAPSSNPEEFPAQHSAKTYLTQFSQAALAALEHYRDAVQPVLQDTSPEIYTAPQKQQLQHLQSALDQLRQASHK